MMLIDRIAVIEWVCLEKTTAGWAGRRHGSLLEEEGGLFAQPWSGCLTQFSGFLGAVEMERTALVGGGRTD